MKKLVLTLAVILSIFSVKAASVSLQEARNIAEKFMNDEVSLVYSTPSFYIFNQGENGFVILSADDSYSPLIGYSNERAFEPDNMAPALQDYLNNINEYRMQRGAAQADAMVARDWESLRKYGHVVSRFGGKDGDYLVQTKWNQNYPYNYFCPADANGPGGHAYAGCVATAAAQLMKYWNHPLQGTGSYTYTPADNPQYGPQTANFGETTYDWNNMPISISANSSMPQIEAVGTLIYHCGVAVDMNYRPTGSGASTARLCDVMPQYFSYTNHMENIYREDYSKEDYLALIFKAIDKNWPMVHRGGGHAYVLDGYDDNGLVHFNWGWSGSNDAFYDIDGHNYTDGQSVIYNVVPASIYNATPDMPTNLTVTADANNDLAAIITWNNPVKTLANQTLTSIDQVVVMRNNVVVYSQNNVTPGAAMSFTDNEIPYFDSYKYRVFTVTDGLIGESAIAENVNIGPTCTWKFVVSSQSMQGWANAYIALYNAAGTCFNKVTVSSSTSTVIDVDMPIGSVTMSWVPSDNTQQITMSLNVKDSQNTSVYSYSGNILNMEEGVFCRVNNGCGNAAPAEGPSDLNVVNDDDDMLLSWTAVPNKDGYGYNVYRDGQLVKLTTANEFVDVNLTIGGHCYQVCYLGLGGESDYSNETCGNVGDGCDSGSDLWYEVQDNHKPLVTWVAPEISAGLTAYYVYRKMDADGEYERAKIVAANKTEFKENKALQEGHFYYYKVLPYYQGIDCFAAPIKSKYNNEYFVKYFYTLDVNEIDANGVSVYPNPTNGVLRIEADALRNVAVYNLVGQKVFEENINGDECVINMNEFGNGIYMVRIESATGSTTKKVSVIE